MTSDRNDLNPDEENENNGVLAETGGIDTTGLGILGGGTEQVSVDLPSQSDDEELDDDDVVGDEVFVESIETVHTGFSPRLERPAYEAEWLGEAANDTGPIAEAVIDEEPEQGWAAPENAQADEGSWHERETVTTSEPAAHTDVVDVEVIDDHSEEAAPAEKEVPVNAAHDGADGTAAATGPEESGQPQPAVADAPARAVDAPTPAAETPRPASAAAVASVVPTTGPLRSTHRSDVALTSKRLGEFEPDRESADLLTADRLLNPSQVVKPEPEGAWQHFVYSITGRRVNLGDSKRARARKDLDRRIAAPLGHGARFVPVLSRKGGVGKTTITTLLGMALADARDDRIIAIDANPDRGTLADRISRHDGKTVRDLVRSRDEISGYAGISSIVARDDTRLDVLASDTDPRIAEAFNDRDYRDVASIAAHYYSIVLTDTGTGIVHSVMQATLEQADQLVIVSGLSVEEARLASETLTWLEMNGYGEQVRGAVVVLNNARPGTPLVRLDELETHFRSRVRAVVRMPYDPLIAAGSAIAFRDLRPETRLAARELAANVVEGLRSLASAA